jgi:hypothetical protein
MFRLQARWRTLTEVARITSLHIMQRIIISSASMIGQFERVIDENCITFRPSSMQD